MLQFFRGWRRKAGVITLVLALAFSIMWGRSRTTMDDLVRFSDVSRDLVQSLDGTLSLSRLTPSMIEEPAMFSLFGDDYVWQSQPAENGFGFDENGVRLPNKLFVGCSNVRRWDCAGITIGSGQMDGGGPMNEPELQIQHYAFPYWSLVLPLTLLSAYLILWKPRKRVNGDA